VRSYMFRRKRLVMLSGDIAHCGTHACHLTQLRDFVALVLVVSESKTGKSAGKYPGHLGSSFVRLQISAFSCVLAGDAAYVQTVQRESGAKHSSVCEPCASKLKATKPPGVSR